MKIEKTILEGVLILSPKIYRDNRGFFFETWNSRIFNKETNSKFSFVQDNHSYSEFNVLRGMHYQIKRPQGKLVRVVSGEILDVVVDINKNSKTFGKWISVLISCLNKKQIWIPPGYAHGILVKSKKADLLYKVTDYYNPELERCILWNDPVLNIDWGLKTLPNISEKDSLGTSFLNAEK